MSAEKPILFSTEMVRAILDGRKTQTRRVVKIKNCRPMHKNHAGDLVVCNDSKPLGEQIYPVKPPLHTGDILWVRETWRLCDKHVEMGACHTDDNCREDNCESPYMRKTDLHYDDERNKAIAKILGESLLSWKPSIHMPRAAARIFLQVTGVRAERLQDISEWDAFHEGCDGESDCIGISVCGTPRDACSECRKGCVDEYAVLWNKLNGKPKPIYATVGGKKTVTHYESYPWENIQETREYRGKPWIVCGNPWVWVYEFKQVSSSNHK